MATLSGTTVASTYKDLLQVSNSNSGIDATLRNISDGEATETPLQLSTTAVKATTGLTFSNLGANKPKPATDNTIIYPYDEGDSDTNGKSVYLKAYYNDNTTGTTKVICDESTGWRALAQGVQWDQSNTSSVLTRLGSTVGYASSVSPGDAALPIHRDMKRCVMNDDGTVNYYLDPDNSINKQYTSTVTSGVTSGTTASNKLKDGTADFVTDAVAAGMWVHNTTDDTY